jgi:hypothetical protein
MTAVRFDSGAVLRLFLDYRLGIASCTIGRIRSTDFKGPLYFAKVKIVSVGAIKNHYFRLTTLKPNVRHDHFRN